MEKRSYKSILLKKYEAFSIEENPMKEKLLKMELLQILRDVENPSPQDFHIWGLIYYKSNVDKEYNTDLALEKFIKAYELDLNNFLACLYVGHCFHDKKDLLSALNYYEKVNQEELKEFQFWRYVKLIEQIGYCHYKLGRKEIGRRKFEEVLNWYKKVEELAVPTEIIECLDESDPLVIEIKEIENYLK